MIGSAVAIVLMIIASIPKKKLKPKVLWPFALIAIFMIIFSIKYMGPIIDSINSGLKGEDSSASIRMPLNRVAIRIIKSRPILGTGLGNYKLVSRDYVIPEQGISIVHLRQEVHNVYLLVAAETGIPGLFFFLLFVFFILQTGRKVMKLNNLYISNLGTGITFCYIAILIQFLSTPDYRIHQIKLLFWMMAGFLYSLKLIDLKMRIAYRRYLHSKKNDREYNKSEIVHNFG